ncbi:MAG: hypothetical protein H7333_07995 [Bdellovibrionales bacterium]|nr:hypothetical protein [Oligoflexia bacterium]
MPLAHAVRTDIEYACLGIDGVPLSAGTSQEAACCQNGQLIANPPALCRAGFNSIGAGAAAGAAFAVNLAQKTLDTAKNMSGASITYTSPTPSEHGLSETKSSGSAITSSGSSGSGDESGTVGAGTSTEAGDSAGSGSRSGGAGSGRGGGGSLGASSSAGFGKRETDGAGEKSADSAGGYVSAGGAGGNADKNALASLNFGNTFGKDGANGKGDGGPSELNFADEAAGSGKDGSEGGEGSSSDAADYLSRIDRSASIFKIVSLRYTKETRKKHVGKIEN